MKFFIFFHIGLILPNRKRTETEQTQRNNQTMSSPMTKTTLEKYQSNLTAGQNILHTFTDTSLCPQVIRYALLVAQMQSGKTFTYMFVFMEMFRQEIIDQVVIFSGNAEVALKKQTQDCLENEEFEQFYKEHLVQNIGMDARGLNWLWKGLKDDVKEKLKVIWGTEGAKYYVPKRRTLFIWDESHFAQDKKMCPDKFLETMGILPNGDFRRLNDSDNYVLSVSATPFSEMCDIQQQKQCKMVVPFVPSETYWSVQKMCESGAIVGYTNLKEEARIQMMDLERFEGQNKIGIIRIPKSSKKEPTKEQTENWEGYFTKLAAQLGYDLLLYYQETEDPRRITNKQFLDLLDEANLTKNTLILVKEHCRMGQVLKKKNISFVMETSNNSSTDVVLQGLLGRMCGYDGSPLIRVCLKESFFDREVIAHDEKTGAPIYGTNELEKYIEFTNQLKRLPCGELPSVIPKRCRNLIQEKTKLIRRRLEGDIVIIEEPHTAGGGAGGGAGYGGDTTEYMYELTPIIPIKLPDTERNVFAANSGHGLGPNQIQAIQDLFDQATNHNDPKITLLVKQQILTNLEKYKSSGNTLGNFESLGINEISGRKIQESITTQTPMKMGSSNGFKPNVIGIFYAYDKNVEKYSQYGIRPGDVFLWMQYENKDKKREIILPKTTGDELFCKTTECGEKLESNGTCAEDLDPKTACDVELMKSAILDSVERSITNVAGKIISRKITSNNAGGLRWTGIYVSNEVFDALKKGDIYEEVLRRFKVKLVLKQPRGRKPADETTMTRLCEISW